MSAAETFQESPWPDAFRQYLPSGRITAVDAGARGPGRPMWWRVDLLNQYGDRVGGIEVTSAADQAAFIAQVNGPAPEGTEAP